MADYAALSTHHTRVNWQRKFRSHELVISKLIGPAWNLECLLFALIFYWSRKLFDTALVLYKMVDILLEAVSDWLPFATIWVHSSVLRGPCCSSFYCSVLCWFFVFVFCFVHLRPVSCVPIDASVSGLVIPDYPFDFLERLFG